MFYEKFALIILLPQVLCRRYMEREQADDQRKGLICCAILLFALWTASIVRYVLKVTNLRTLHGVLMILMGIALQLIVSQIPGVDFNRIITNQSFIIYVPFAIFGIAIRLNIHLFVRSLHQILIISLPAAIVNITLVGFAMKILIGKNWSAFDAIYFGIMLNPIYPVEILSYLKQCGSNVREVCNLLEGETLIGFSVTILLADICYLHGSGTEWSTIAFHVASERSFEILVGLLIGVAACYMMRFSSHDAINVIVSSVSFVCFATFISFCVEADGTIAAMIVSLMVSNNKSSLPTDVLEHLKSVWKVISYLFNSFFLIYCGIMITSKAVGHIKLRDVAMTFASYLILNISRFLSILIFVPILSRIGNGLSFRHMIICVWSGLKSPYIFILSINMMTMMGPKFEFEVHAVNVFVWSYLINGTTLPILLRFLGYAEISVIRQTNMNMCFRYIQHTKDSVVEVLKMDRFFSDANWGLVQKSTTMKHPYRSKSTDEGEGEQELLGLRTSKCPDCNKDVVHEPTPKEFRDMLREARLRVLKAKKISYSRQFEQGMLRKDSMISLIQAVEIAMDTKEAFIELEGLEKLFKKENIFYRCLKKHTMKKYFEKHQNMRAESRIPNTKFKQCCHKIVTHWFYDVFMVLVIIVNVVFIYLEYFYNQEYIKIWGLNMEFALSSGAIFITFLCFYVLFLIEFFMKIYGFAWVTIFDGFKYYFKSLWNYFDLALLGINLVVVVIYAMEYRMSLKYRTTYEHIIFSATFKFLLTLRFIKVVRLLFVLYPKMVQLADHKNDRYRQYVYDIAMGYLVADSEILETLSNMIDNKKIRDDTRHRMERDKLKVIKLMATSQKERPWIAVTVKTKQTAKTVINSMKDAVVELKVAGWIDDTELIALLNSLTLSENKLDMMPLINPCMPKELFMDVPWISASPEEVKEYLFKNVAVKKYDPGDVVCYDGQIAEGIYIVVDGLFFVTYLPHPNTIQMLKNFGCLPVADYLPVHFANIQYYDYIVNGNFIGELSTLTKRAYNCTICAETYSQVFVLKRSIIRRAIQMNPDPVRGFECQLWKSVSRRIAVSVLLQVPAYQNYTHEKLRHNLERAFVPNLRNYKFFIINQMIEDIVIIEGVALDANTKEKYAAPCYVPRTVQKLLLPSSSKTDFATKIETKMLILPAINVDEYEIMAMEMDTCELIETDSSICMRHLTSVRLKQRKAKSRPAAIKTRFALIEEKASKSSRSSKSESQSVRIAE